MRSSLARSPASFRVVGRRDHAPVAPLSHHNYEKLPFGLHQPLADHHLAHVGKDYREPGDWRGNELELEHGIGEFGVASSLQVRPARLKVRQLTITICVIRFNNPPPHALNLLGQQLERYVWVSKSVQVRQELPPAQDYVHVTVIRRQGYFQHAKGIAQEGVELPVLFEGEKNCLRRANQASQTK